MITNHVQHYRKERRLTQEELAKQVGVTRKTVVSLEKGNYIPSLLLALSIAHVLEVDINCLFQKKNESEKSR